jgi:hypothetical protein
LPQHEPGTVISSLQSHPSHVSFQKSSAIQRTEKSPHEIPPAAIRSRRLHGAWLLLGSASQAAATANGHRHCQRSPSLPTVTVTDTEPVGDGLKVIGFAMLGAAVVVVLGRMLG